MRIISDFHDYYDAAQKFGQDAHVIYNRRMREFRDRVNTPEVISTLEQIAKSHVESQHGGRWSLSRYPSFDFATEERGVSLTATPGCVFFCGNIYPYLRVRTAIIGSVSEPPVERFYNASAAIEYIEKAKVINLDKQQRYSSKLSRRQLIDEYFSHEASPRLREWLIEKKVTTALWVPDLVTLDPALKDVQFFKRFDAWTAYQELDMWISGTLSYPQEVVIEIEDKYKIPQHGFDKWSFRKRPETS